MALLPNQIYSVFKASPISSFGLASLTYLYQPIIGSQAIHLYQLLLAESEEAIRQEKLHVDLCEMLDEGIQQVEAHRLQLEGIGLLNVYLKDEELEGQKYFYQLQEPLAPSDFFKDEILSFMLLSRVGERIFAQLSKRFANRQVSLAGYTEVTHSFLDVFRVENERFIQALPKLEKTKEQHQANELSTSGKSVQLDIEKALDWPFLFQLAQKQYIDKKVFTPDFCEKLALYHVMYGLDELTLVEYMRQVVQLVDGTIDEKALEQLILSNQRQQSAKPSQSNLSAEVDTDRQQALRKERLLKQGFSLQDWEIIESSELYPPMTFLESIKQAKNSYVTKDETWIIRDLLAQSPLAPAVINVLIHYALVIQNHSVLQSKFVHRIATDWSQQKIATPEQAILHVRQLVKEAKDKRQKSEQTKKTANYSKNIRQEVIPDWMKNPKVAAVDAEKSAATQKALEALRKREED
ncbi:replication initiation and membrane attachment family protein [Enterococcus columbae]|uniref:Uncharacterized protein n=1 Tax=Enterococcus columbae DSM 7374 = ATCC 51263 TaxID=1121865 RepID=S0KHW7_9ENTE|nr:DnaD domain protein [Enterococcus columbae]EOT44399.1 hypothetical protein OMW_00455 [Enterococcus columbae DSM 7374 = ATCC 51263]EOW84557.1 hypothetical protein I568_01053 [Enterococcus columbae DSM 7374 = ATCC 51263]OJG22531.1 hypothetical protein RR47_GL000970 [Enterococcus columbae DSM 7374 = ATCC 51263]